MTHASTSLDDLVRGISATAPPADDEALIELHSAQQRVFPSHAVVAAATAWIETYRRTSAMSALRVPPGLISRQSGEACKEPVALAS